MSLPPSSHPSPDHQSQAGASAIAWWQENFDKISETSIPNAPAPATTTPVTKPTSNSTFPPSRITIPVQIHPPAATSATRPSPTPNHPAPPSDTSAPLIDLLSNDDVPSTMVPPPVLPPQQAHTNPTVPPAVHQFAATPHTPYSTPYGHSTTVPPSTNHWASAVPPMYNNNINPYVQSTLHQHSNILSNMTATLNMLQGNQDFLLDKLNDITKTLQQTQSTFSKFLQKQPLEIPSLASSANSNSHSNSLPSNLSYTQEQFDQASSTSASAKHYTMAEPSHADKKLYPQKYTYDPNNRIAARCCAGLLLQLFAQP
jgi:hypothetical protein